MTVGRGTVYIGKILKQAREEAGLSIRELARSAGVDATYISKLENRRVPIPSFSVLSRICASLPDSSGKHRMQSALLREDIMSIDSKLAKLNYEKHALLSDHISRVARDVLGVCQLLGGRLDANEERSMFAEVLDDALVMLGRTDSRVPAAAEFGSSRQKRRR